MRKKKILPGRVRECWQETEWENREKVGVGGRRMNANREPKTSTEALSFTGGGATIANTFSLTLAL